MIRGQVNEEWSMWIKRGQSLKHWYWKSGPLSEKKHEIFLAHDTWKLYFVFLCPKKNIFYNLGHPPAALRRIEPVLKYVYLLNPCATPWRAPAYVCVANLNIRAPPLCRMVAHRICVQFSNPCARPPDGRRRMKNHFYWHMNCVCMLLKSMRQPPWRAPAYGTVDQL